MRLMMVTLILMLTGCGDGANSKATPGQLHLLVDGETIRRGNWAEIAAPMTWWLDIHGGENLYLRDGLKFTREQRILNAAHIYLEEVVVQGHQAFLSRTSTTVQKDIAAGLEALGLSQHQLNFISAVKKISDKGNQETDLSDEDSVAIQLKESQPSDAVFIRFVQSHGQAFYYSQYVQKPAGS